MNKYKIIVKIDRLFWGHRQCLHLLPGKIVRVLNLEFQALFNTVLENPVQQIIMNNSFLTLLSNINLKPIFVI